LTDHNLHSPENEKLLLQPIADTLQRAREISRRLTPNHMKKVGLVLAIEDMLQNAEKLSGVKIVTQLDALENYFPENWSIECYRIVQEAVTNALKHSHATAIEVRTRRIDKNLELVIADNGRGMSEGAASGIGMALMRERVRALGGHLFTQDGQPGLRLVVILPPG
jgi:signal transduction histidine kinase